jgi:hypothetical protein
MELTIQEVHSYNNLVNEGKEEKLKLSGVDDDSIVIPRLDELDRVYFYDLSSKARIYPGRNVIEKIKKAIDNQRNR